MRLQSVRRVVGALSLVVAAVAAPAAQASYTGLYVFGDSLSDAGNNASFGLFDPTQVVTGNSYIAQAAYAPAGTYSNGPVWASSFAAMLGLSAAPSNVGGTNYAYGGARLTSDQVIGAPFNFTLKGLTSQVAQLKADKSNVLDSNALYVVEAGGNDARDALAAIALLDSNSPTYAADADAIGTAAIQAYVAGVKGIVDTLQAGGAQHIVVWNTPNIGAAPATQTFGPAGVFVATGLASAMSNAISFALASEPADVVLFDIFGLVGQQLVNPLYSNVTDACGAAAPGTDCSKYLWWDGVHPTATGHAVIAGALAAQLHVGEVPEPETWALFAAGLAGLVVVRRRATRA